MAIGKIKGEFWGKARAPKKRHEIMATAEIISHIESPGVRRELERGLVQRLTANEFRWYITYRSILSREPSVRHEPWGFKLFRMMGWAIADQCFQRVGMA